MFISHSGYEIVAVETERALCRPGTTRIGRIGVSLVLVHYHVDGDVFLGIDLLVVFPFQLSEILGFLGIQPRSGAEQRHGRQ